MTAIHTFLLYHGGRATIFLPAAPRTPTVDLISRGEPAIDTSELNFEATIEDALLRGGYRHRRPDHFDRDLCLDPDVLFEFLDATQPRTLEKLKAQYPGGEHRSALLRRISTKIAKDGAVHVLRRGVSDRGCSFRLAYFRPETALNEEHARLYDANQFSVVRQLPYRTRDKSGREGRLDLAIFLNGIPLFTVELKVSPANYKNAIAQYQTDRDPKEPLFAFKRCLAHFAMDTDLVYLTTRLAGARTVFLPFNQGYEKGAGNQPSKTGFAVRYMWEDVWTKDSVLELIRQFVHVVEEPRTDAQGRRRRVEKLIFPRYHQRDAVRRLVADARDKGAGERYLVQHSAGSGKSNTIAWLAHRLSSLHDANDEPVFHTVVVITDRRVLDRQLQSTVKSFEQTPGVVENIDQRSRQLADAIRDGKKIIVTTVQKFPVIDRDVRAMADRRFAVIIDEAHSSQSGESSASVKKVLSWATLEEAARAEGNEPETMEDRIEAEMRARGPVPNVSMFAFTATPKKKTLQLFGVPRSDGKEFEAFSLYSMKQAIQEGFIMDVLENYTTYRSYWRLLKKIEDDPHYEQGKAKGLLKRMVELQDHAIEAKVRVIVDHFENSVRHRIAGEAKAMVVTRSRKHALYYCRALRAELRERKLPHKALVAFADFEDGGEKWTEQRMNDMPESQTAAAFNRPEYRFLVVAEKFQTGFDQPLLHTMYVDKKLAGVHAVQTLSRLNRTHPAKKETMVLDFANETDEILDAFKDYYEKTILSEGTDPNVLYDVCDELEQFGVYGAQDVEDFAAIAFRPVEGRAAKGKAALDQRHAEAVAFLEPFVDAWKALDDEDRDVFRRRLRRYCRLYGFLSQIVTFTEARLEKVYVFASLLLRRLPADPSDLPVEVLDAVDMASYRLAKTSEGKVELPAGPGRLEPDAGGDRPASEDPLKPLSEIVEELNRAHGYVGNGATEKSLAHVFEQVETDVAIDAAVRNNPPESAKLTFSKRLREHTEDLVDENFRLYKRLVEDPAFGDSLQDMLFERYLASTRYVDELIAQGEGTKVEFKSTLRYDVELGEMNERVITHMVLKTIAAFVNTEGGRLLIGVADDRTIVGVELDELENPDQFMRHLTNVVKNGLGLRTATCLDPAAKVLQGKTVCVVLCRKSPEPVVFKWKGVNKDPDGDFYVRTGPATELLERREAREYIRTRFGDKALAASPLANEEPTKEKPVIRPATPFDSVLRRVEPTPETRYKTAFPLVELDVAAGAFSDEQATEHGVLDEAPEWVELLQPPPKKKLKPAPGTFVTRVVGRSMEPRIPDGSYCVFRAPVTGSRNNRVVLVTARNLTDAEHGGRYTVKLYQSAKTSSEDDGWQHEAITLRPTNKEFVPIELGPDDDVAVLAELVLVL